MMVEIITDFEKLENIRNMLPVFALKEYLRCKSENHGWFKSEKFILPYYVTRKFIFKRLFFTTSTIYLKSGDITENSLREERAFLDEIIRLCRINGIDIIDAPQVNAIFNIFPDKARYLKFGSFIIDLRKDEQTLFKELHQKHRNVIRKAEKDGITIESGDGLIDDCYEIIRNTYSRQKKPFIPLNELRVLAENLKGHISFYVAKKDENIQGCAVLLWNGTNTCYYQFGGSIVSPYTGSLNYLHWKAMSEMKKKGVLSYDFFGARLNVREGSKIEGIQRFKERFGGELKIGYLWKYPINKFKYVLFKLVNFVISLLKLRLYKGDLIDSEGKRD